MPKRKSKSIPKRKSKSIQKRKSKSFPKRKRKSINKKIKNYDGMVGMKRKRREDEDEDINKIISDISVLGISDSSISELMSDLNLNKIPKKETDDDILVRKITKTIEYLENNIKKLDEQYKEIGDEDNPIAINIRKNKNIVLEKIEVLKNKMPY
jgi:hypothetical protein